MAPYRPLFKFHMLNILQTVLLVHYYKTKFDVSGEDAP